MYYTLLRRTALFLQEVRKENSFFDNAFTAMFGSRDTTCCYQPVYWYFHPEIKNGLKGVNMN
ncbi:hypothetical protein FLA_4034 [Filimonas lacunae]|nr:hypothetical protein FLA_4034 [Filimonas lacunae]